MSHRCQPCCGSATVSVCTTPGTDAIDPGDEIGDCERLHAGPPKVMEMPLFLSRTADLAAHTSLTLGQARAWFSGDWIAPEDVTIIVLNWNRAEETLGCLESLEAADLRGARVLVVDNGSRDGSVERIGRRFPRQKVLPLPENYGYAGGNNAGIRLALATGARAVHLLNNDTRVAPNFLAPLLWILNTDPKAAAVSSAIMRMDCPVVLDCAFLELYFGHGIVRQRGVNALPSEGFDTSREIEVAVGCSVLVRGAALREVGLFDESYFAYHEDVDWCFRCRQAGYKIYYQPLSRVWHGGSKSTGALANDVKGPRTVVSGPQLANPMPLSWNPVRAYLGARNTVRFVRRHGTARQQLYFLGSSLYNVPLELLAAVLRREDALKIGAWTYGRALRLVAFGDDRPEALREKGVLRSVAHVPVGLFWEFPREAWRAHREGRTGQVIELVRGLLDGAVNRALPLGRLKLDGAVAGAGGTHAVYSAEREPRKLRVEPARVTIVVLNWKRAEETIACLESLQEADLGGASVLVVDNGSGDGSVERIRERFPDQRIVALPENRGYAGGNNEGIRVALEDGAEAVLLLNNDTRVAPDFLAPLLDTLTRDPEAGAVSGAIMRSDRPEMLDVAFGTVQFHRREAVRILGVNALPGEGFDRRCQVDVAVGCCLLLTAEALGRVGLLDENYFAYHEDVDWCLRAREAGFRVYYEPYSRVFHSGSRSTAVAARPVPDTPADNGNPALPNAEPLPWNPIRTYLGARNTVRLLRRHATVGEKLAFARSCAFELPLVLLSVIKGKEGWLRLGRWGYRDFLREHIVERHPPPALGPFGRAATIKRALVLLLWAPVDLFWTLPIEFAAARRAGRTAELAAYLRGLRDGLLGRPIPLERLGLR
jgi:GT2 family glycosyltransferase